MIRKCTTVQSKEYSVGEMICDLLGAMRKLIDDGKCKKLNDEQKTYVDLLADALQRFYEDDAEELFKDNPVDERSMVGCIARYMWCMNRRGRFEELMPDVDVEFNKLYLSKNEVKDKGFYVTMECKEECKYKEGCGKMIEAHFTKEKKGEAESFDDRLGRFRPDVIVHRRGSTKNGMLVEFKKESAYKDERAQRRMLFDFAKIRFCTCEEISRLKYKVGAFVMLRKKMSDVFVFVENCPVMAFKVAEKGKIESQLSVGAKNCVKEIEKLFSDWGSNTEIK